MIQEVSLGVSDLLLLLIVLGSVLFLESASEQILVNSLLHLFLLSFIKGSFVLKTFEEDVVFDILDNVGVDVSELLSTSKELILLVWMNVTLPNPHSLYMINVILILTPYYSISNLSISFCL